MGFYPSTLSSTAIAIAIALQLQLRVLRVALASDRRPQRLRSPRPIQIHCHCRSSGSMSVRACSTAGVGLAAVSRPRRPGERGHASSRAVREVQRHPGRGGHDMEHVRPRDSRAARAADSSPEAASAPTPAGVREGLTSRMVGRVHGQSAGENTFSVFCFVIGCCSCAQA